MALSSGHCISSIICKDKRILYENVNVSLLFQLNNPRKILPVIWDSFHVANFNRSFLNYVSSRIKDLENTHNLNWNETISSSRFFVIIFWFEKKTKNKKKRDTKAEVLAEKVKKQVHETYLDDDDDYYLVQRL
ncbi:CLUMA_CG000466, isoform A [Clunio marinus]|uniref:CLUMA_CG000466, isoform A n=1 Tax=Clunio marinus TaxID=568069 RepID=A0A1J1HJI1_9DIPT|nr:CLUMA_CG000466, isoform A [Clunio marinus]